MPQIYFRQQNSDTDLFRSWTCLTQLTTNLEIQRPSVVTFSGAIDFHHRGIVNGVIGYAVCLTVSRVQDGNSWPVPTWNTPRGTLIAGSINGGNILSETDHYGKGVWTGYVKLDLGRWQVRAYGNSHSSLGPDTDGLAEVLVESAGLNGLIVRVDDAL
jgi:hypothetical protein